MTKGMNIKLDSLDLKIIHQLQKNGRTSVTELSERVESTRQTVTNRLKRLIEEELILIQGGLDITKFDFKIADVGLEVRGEDTRKDIEKFLKECPRVLDIFRTPDRANYRLRVWGENDQTLNSTIESFGDVENVSIVYTHYLGTPIHGNITINIESSKKDETPCGKMCAECNSYSNVWCLGCPISKDYKNVLTR
jgi:DNA-binding Lrp family transcriptional regulator